MRPAGVHGAMILVPLQIQHLLHAGCSMHSLFQSTSTACHEPAQAFAWDLTYARAENSVWRATKLPARHDCSYKQCI